MRLRFRLFILIALASAGCLLAQTSVGGREKKATGRKQLASVDGVAITEAQARTESAAKLDALELKILKSKATFAMNEHEILEEAVEQLLEDRLCRAEAAKLGISKEEYIARETQKNIQEPTNEEIEQFYEANKQRIQKSKEEVLPQISKYLRQQRESFAKQALMDRLEKEHKVVRSLEPLRFSVEAPGRSSVGPASAPVVLVLFSDFQCPYCRGMGETLKEVLQQYGNKIRLVFRQFPLTSIHPYAQKAAEASLCAAAQSRFWEMHDLMFQDQKGLSENELKSKAEKIGLNTAVFNACLDGNTFAAQVREDVRAGASAGADGTPVLFINGRFMDGNRPFEQIAEIIDEELQKKSKPSK